jgi:hypothetical protein
LVAVRLKGCPAIKSLRNGAQQKFISHWKNYMQEYLQYLYQSHQLQIWRQNDLHGRTALHLAARKWRGDDMFRRIFSEAGPRAMNLPDSDGWTPLHWLAFNGSEQMAFALSHPGIDVSIRDLYGRTPLDFSTRFRPVLQAYGDQEARWQPMRYAWIKLLIIQHGDDAR